MRNKHVFVGGKDDIFVVYEATQSNTTVYWAVPKEAEVRDQGFFLLPKDIGFYALGEVSSSPELDGNKFTGYRADIKILLRLQQNVKLRNVQSNFLNWIDVQHPRVWNRSFTIPTAFYPQFYSYLLNAQKDYQGRTELNQVIR